MPKTLTDKQVTEQQLKDAKTLASAPRGFLPTKGMRDQLKKKDIGKWHAQKAD